MLLIASLFLFSCYQNKKEQVNQETSDDFSQNIFTNDTTLFRGISLNTPKHQRDSILKSNGFINKNKTWSNDRIIFQKIGRGIQLKIIKPDQHTQLMQKINEKMQSLKLYKSGAQFSHGVDIYQLRPFQEIYKIMLKDTCILKIFPRNRI